MTKSVFSGVRASVVGSLLAAAGLAGCSSCNTGCNQPNPCNQPNACAPKCEPCVAAPVYRSPCCEAQMQRGGGGYMAPGYAAPGYAAPMGTSQGYATPSATGTPHNSGYAGPGSQMACGAGKCG